MRRPNVLLVEDDPIVAADIKHKLRDFGFEVCSIVASGEDALDAVRTHRPAAVLMDVTLEGGMDGIEAAGEIRRSLRVPIVFLTAHSDQATVQRAKLTLPYGYVLKPVRDVELKIALEVAIYTGSRTHEKTGGGIAPASGCPRVKQTDEERYEVLAVLSGTPPLSKVHQTLLTDIAPHCYLRDYRPLEIVSMEGDDAEETDGFIVLSGRLAMLKRSLNGRELVVQLLGPLSTFGLLASLESQTVELTARAQVRSKVIHIPKASLLYLLSEMPELYPDFLSEVSRRLSTLHDMARSLAHDRVDVRVAATLAMFVDVERSEAHDRQVSEVNVSRQELADLSGTTVETAIRVTRNLEKSGILDLPDHRVIRVLNPGRLRMIGEGAER